MSDEPDLVAGNVKQRRFKDIWTNAPLFRQTRSFDTKDIGGICGRCAFNEFGGGACRLSAYRAEDDMLAPYDLCQRFYNEGYIPEDLLDPPPVRPSPVNGKLRRSLTHLPIAQ